MYSLLTLPLLLFLGLLFWWSRLFFSRVAASSTRAPRLMLKCRRAERRRRRNKKEKRVRSGVTRYLVRWSWKKDGTRSNAPSSHFPIRRLTFGKRAPLPSLPLSFPPFLSPLARDRSRSSRY